MKTKSEYKTELESKKVFLPEFVNYSIKYQSKDGEIELCDCLLEFQNIYTVIEVKERDKDYLEVENKNWFRNKVERNGINQIVRFYNQIKEPNNAKFYDEKNNEIFINKTFRITPIIVFDNPSINDYKRVIFCRRINDYINVFSLKDFNEAFDTLLIPYEINLYLSFRIAAFKKDDTFLKSHLIIGEFGDKTILWGGGIRSEYELAQYYYGVRVNINDPNVGDPNSIAEKLYLFNKVTTHIRASLELGSKDKIVNREIISFINSVDISSACGVAVRWQKCLSRCKEKDGYYSPYFLAKEETGLLLLSEPASWNTEELIKLGEVLMVLYAYKRHLTDIYLIGFHSIDEEVETIFNVKKFSRNHFEYPDEELEDAIKRYEEAGIKI